MFADLHTALAFLAALGSGLMAGVFFAFSGFIMRALGRLPAASGIAAMQSINVAVINPVFLGAFLGTAALCGVLAILALAGGPVPRDPWLLAGSLAYLLGTFLATMTGNVPLNKALAAAAPGTAEGEALWPIYLVRWRAWNHLRTVSSLVALACFVAALQSP